MKAYKLTDTPITHDQYQRDKIRRLKDEVRMWQNLCCISWFCWVMFEAAFIYLTR